MSSCQECLIKNINCSLSRRRAGRLPKTCTRCLANGLVCVLEDGTRNKHQTRENRITRSAKRQNNQSQLSHHLTTGNSVSLLQDVVLQNPATILVAIDFGTGNVKAAYRVIYPSSMKSFYGSPAENQLGVHPISWSSGSNTLPSMLAFENSEQGGTSKWLQLWGYDVLDALDSKSISTDQVFYNLKPALLNPEGIDAEEAERKIAALDPSAQRSRLYFSSNGPDAQNKLKISDLFSDFMGHVFGYILGYIAEHEPNLQWPTDDDSYPNFQPPSHQVVEVALTLPVGTTPAQQTLVQECARLGGISRPYFIGEPSAGLVFHLFASQESNLGKVIAILDIGKGSVDLQIWKIISENPYRVEELIPGKTNWYGGAAVDRRGVALIMNEVEDENSLCNALSRHGHQMTVDSLQALLAVGFEKAKIGFNAKPGNIRNVHFPGMVPQTGCRMFKQDTIVLEPQDFVNAYEIPLQKITDMLRSALCLVDIDKDVDEILMIGGGGGGWGSGKGGYLRTKIREEFAGDGTTVTTPPDAHDITLAKGAIILLSDKNIIHTRVIQRSYGVLWDQLGESPSSYRRRPKNLQLSQTDKQWRLIDMIQCIVQVGTKVPREYVARIRGDRALMFDFDQNDELGWPIEERLYYSNRPIEHNVWVEDEVNELQPMENPLSFRILPEDVAGFSRNIIHTSSATGRKWYEIQYEVRLLFSDNDLSFQLVIPKCGTFDSHRDGEMQMQDVIVKEGRYDVAGNFHLRPSA